MWEAKSFIYRIIIVLDVARLLSPTGNARRPGEVSPLKIRHAGPAARQLDAILAYFEARSEDAAANVLSRIDEALSIAAEQPRIGQLTRRPGFRRSVIAVELIVRVPRRFWAIPN
jgi:plasmid stabilization system protein ParE